MAYSGSNGRPRVAFFDFTGCEGCQLTVLDLLQTDIELLDAVEIVQFREAMSELGQDYQIAFVEGCCSRPEDEERLRAIRQQAEIVVALGACAHLGGVSALRNWQNLDEVRRYVYGEGGRLYDVDSVRPIEVIIPVEAVVPGCPVDRYEFARTVKMLLQGRQPILPDYPVCVECRLKENVCLYWRGQACLGPLTRAGCEALCPTFGSGCWGCRGLVPNPNTRWLKAAMAEHGISKTEANAQLRLFLSYQLLEGTDNGSGNR